MTKMRGPPNSACRHALLAALAIALGCASSPRAVPRPAAPPAPPERGTFNLRQGTTVVITERFTRTDTLLVADLVVVNGPRSTYSARLNPDGSVASIEVREYAVAAARDAQPSAVVTANFAGDSVIVTRGREVARVRLPAGTVAYVNPSPSLMAQLVLRARAIGGDDVSVPFWVPDAGGQPSTARVRLAPTGAHLVLGGIDVMLEFDARGRLTGGSVPMQNITIERTDGTD
ncbi:MAG TPA: hypothetical protein VMM18_14955 [Gemmatimonadaceae bacterium]|nr:hypothetical protein [Gemmatimonadaceae bacterium]